MICGLPSVASPSIDDLSRNVEPRCYRSAWPASKPLRRPSINRVSRCSAEPSGLSGQTVDLNLGSHPQHGRRSVPAESAELMPEMLFGLPGYVPYPLFGLE